MCVKENGDIAPPVLKLDISWKFFTRVSYHGEKVSYVY